MNHQVSAESRDEFLTRITALNGISTTRGHRSRGCCFVCQGVYVCQYRSYAHTMASYSRTLQYHWPIPLPESYMYTSRQQRAICRSPSYWAIAVCCKRLEGVVERENPPGGPIQGGASQSSFISPAQSDLRRQNLRYGSQLSGGDILPALLGSSSVYLAMARLGIRCGFERRMGSLSYVSFR